MEEEESFKEQEAKWLLLICSVVSCLALRSWSPLQLLYYYCYSPLQPSGAGHRLSHTPLHFSATFFFLPPQGWDNFQTDVFDKSQ